MRRALRHGRQAAVKRRHNICKECGITRQEAADGGDECERYDSFSGDFYYGFNHVWTYQGAAMFDTKGTKVHKISYLRNRRRETPCGKFWYTDWPRWWQFRGTLAWARTTCGNCMAGRAHPRSWLERKLARPDKIIS